ncbi:hypothetical protein UNSW2_588 [Campylobacter concisus UNSW2]|uniref:Uncharacterized protein n=1 Tax=Campylobacter concisus UNSW2 TaxID=1242965 RepID=U2GZM6_9BACT|nr:hypothetical protein UNSW2_588 [Campylobacter concisus UNSW2]
MTISNILLRHTRNETSLRGNKAYEQKQATKHGLLNLKA